MQGDPVIFLLFIWIPHNWYSCEKSGQEQIGCGGTLINPRYAVSAFHCITFITDNFEAIKELLPLGTKPLDFFIVVAGAYHSRNYTLHSNSEPEYDFQVSTMY